MHAVTKYDPDNRHGFCKWIQRKVAEDAPFLGTIDWTEEATFKLNGTVNRHSCVYWSSENPNVHAPEIC
jgi:hypothetical protein